MKIRLCVLRLCGIALALLAAVEGSHGQTGVPLLQRAGADLVRIESDGDDFVYSYQLTNSPNSRSGVGLVTLDLKAPPGTGTVVLPATGEFKHWVDGGTSTLYDHVPVGPISPQRWQALLPRSGILYWFGIEPGVEDYDSIAPGASVEGFGLRSPYLPGIRATTAEPTWQSCCSKTLGELGADPDILDPDEHPSPDQFQVDGLTVGPRYAADTMTLEELQSLQSEVCGSLPWISNQGVCTSLEGKLNAAHRSRERGQTRVAKQQIESFLAELTAQRGKSVSENAFWLLHTNGEAVLSSW